MDVGWVHRKRCEAIKAEHRAKRSRPFYGSLGAACPWCWCGYLSNTMRSVVLCVTVTRVRDLNIIYEAFFGCFWWNNLKIIYQILGPLWTLGHWSLQPSWCVNEERVRKKGKLERPGGKNFLFFSRFFRACYLWETPYRDSDSWFVKCAVVCFEAVSIRPKDRQLPQKRISK